jgi:hypothetical protein
MYFVFPVLDGLTALKAHLPINTRYLIDYQICLYANPIKSMDYVIIRFSSSPISKFFFRIDASPRATPKNPFPWTSPKNVLLPTEFKQKINHALLEQSQTFQGNVFIADM